MKAQLKKRRRQGTICPNCEHILETNANFCSMCGQENHDITHAGVGHLLYETIESIWHFDNKFWATFQSIFTKPGQLSLDFLSGKRARYVPPIRLYIFVSAFFFWFVNKALNFSIQKDLDSSKEGTKYSLFTLKNESLLKELDRNPTFLYRDFIRQSQLDAVIIKDSLFAIIKDRDSLYSQSLTENFQRYLNDRGVQMNGFQKTKINTLQKEEFLEIQRDTLVWSNKGSSRQLKRYDIMGRIVMDSITVERIMNHYTSSQIDSLIQAANPRNNSWIRKLPLRIALKSYKNIERNEADIGGILLSTVKNASIAMFFLMPLVALFLWVFFKRNFPFYAQHLIVSIYSHAATYLLLILFFSTEFLPNSLTQNDYLQIALLVLVWLYVGLSFKRTYQQNWHQIGIKYLIVSVLYFSLLAISVMGIFGYNMLFS